MFCEILAIKMRSGTQLTLLENSISYFAVESVCCFVPDVSLSVPCTKIYVEEIHQPALSL